MISLENKYERCSDDSGIMSERSIGFPGLSANFCFDGLFCFAWMRESTGFPPTHDEEHRSSSTEDLTI